MTAKTDITTPAATASVNTTQVADSTRRHPWWHHVLSVIMCIVTCAVSIATIISAWAGSIDPEDIPVAGVCVMVLPILAPILLAVFIIDVF